MYLVFFKYQFLYFSQNSTTNYVNNLKWNNWKRLFLFLTSLVINTTFFGSFCFTLQHKIPTAKSQKLKAGMKESVPNSGCVWRSGIALFQTSLVAVPTNRPFLITPLGSQLPSWQLTDQQLWKKRRKTQGSQVNSFFISIHFCHY